MHKGLRKTESLMPWKTLILATPLIAIWAYYDTKEDIKHIEGAQLRIESILSAPDREHGEQGRGTPYGPVPAVTAPLLRTHEAPAETVKTVAKPGPKDYGLQIIKTDRKITANKMDAWCLAKNIFHEAGVEDRLGRYAVAQVTLNRVRSSRYPNTICDVVYDRSQFSWTLDRSLRKSRPAGPLWRESVKVAEDVINRGYRVKGLESAMFYHADYVDPFWRKPEAKIAKVGTHIFYASAR
jgi:hypothetical protein